MVLQSCLPREDHLEVLSFWTDTIIDVDTEYALYINDERVGSIEERYENVECNMTGLINVEIIDNQDMNLLIMDSNGSIVDIGMINLSSPSNGLSIKPKGQVEIFVTHEIDDPCTLVRLRW
tara:strand:- start:651 stop:1013 length:363 start_codon:yes stop_codon:yes gene_type:complete